VHLFYSLALQVAPVHDSVGLTTNARKIQVPAPVTDEQTLTASDHLQSMLMVEGRKKPQVIAHEKAILLHFSHSNRAMLRDWTY
jgi:hypothetical protein